MLQETSIAARLSLPMGELQKRYLDLLAIRDYTDQEAGRAMAKAASTVSGIRRPLVICGKVEEYQVRRCGITGRNVIAWRLSPPKTNQLF